MKNMLFLFLALFFLFQVPVFPDNDTADSNTKYSIEDVIDLFRKSKVGNINFKLDDHIYKCIKIKNEADDLKGTLDALALFKIDFGDSLEDDEIEVLIEMSKLDTTLFKDIALNSKNIRKRKTTIDELYLLIDNVKKNNGKDILNGLNIAKKCNYELENDYFSAERLELLRKIGVYGDIDRFVGIYLSMNQAGMKRIINSRGLELIYQLSLLEGDVSEIISVLKKNKWKSRQYPGVREYMVIKDTLEDSSGKNVIDSPKSVITDQKNVIIDDEKKKIKVPM